MKKLNRRQHDAQIRGYKAHCVVIDARQMGQKFCVAGKTVATQEKRALIYRRRGDRIDAAGSTQLDRGFDVAGGRLAGGARFNSRFDKTPNVVEVKNDGLSEVSGEPFSAPHNVVAASQVKRAGRVRQ